MSEETKLILEMLEKLGNRMENVENTVTNLDSKVSNLETTVSNLDSKVSNLEKTVSNLDSKVSNLEKTASNLDSKVSNLEKTASNLDSKVSNLESTVSNIQMTLENETNRNIKIIAEGHCDLARKLDEALQIENEKELMQLRLNSLENDMKQTKERLDKIA